MQWNTVGEKVLTEFSDLPKFSDLPTVLQLGAETRDRRSYKDVENRLGKEIVKERKATFYLAEKKTEIMKSLDKWMKLGTTIFVYHMSTWGLSSSEEGIRSLGIGIMDG
ncbi:hypothetical protein STEG23_013597 [Scotinomys teguina]